MKNYKFPFKVYENKKKVFDKVYDLKNGLTKNDLFEITHQINQVIEQSIKEHHKSKLKKFLL
jgi:nucleoid DNA-binding protein